MTDFGADHAFGQIDMKLKEHYGIRVPTSSARRITEWHAQELHKQEQKAANTNSAYPKSIILAETDGSMVPIVRFKAKPEGAEKYDARKHKEHIYREARLSLAHAVGSVTPVFAGTLGTVNEVGQQLRECVEKVGCDEHTKIYCVGDGAPWIANQVEEQFGLQGSYLVDFYHVCEYLAAAAAACGEGKPKEWLEKQKENLKAGAVNDVLNELCHYCEPPTVNDKDAPVRCCYRYLDNRRDQIDYPGAIEKGLPIGSGEIESAHKYVIQQRLKTPGAWWKEENAADMLALRVNRANEEWENYWNSRKAV